jgi:hypothetical protein
MRAGYGKVLVSLEQASGEGVFWGDVIDLGPGTKSGMSMRMGCVAFDIAKAVRVGEDGKALYVVKEDDVLAFEANKQAPELPKEEEKAEVKE